MSTNENTKTVSVDVKAIVSAIADAVNSGKAPNVAISESDYGIADRAEKARIRGAFKARFDSAMRDGNFDLAQINWGIHDAFKNASGNSKRESVSNSDEMRSIVRGMARALSGMISGEFAPNGMDAVDLSEEFEFEFDFTGEYDGTEFEVTSEFVSRFVPKRVTRNAPANDIAELVGEFLAANSGTEFKVSEIRKGIAEMHPELDTEGWDGRITARLFPDGKNSDGTDCTIPNVRGIRRKSDGRNCGIHTA